LRICAHTRGIVGLPPEPARFQKKGEHGDAKRKKGGARCWVKVGFFRRSRKWPPREKDTLEDRRKVPYLHHGGKKSPPVKRKIQLKRGRARLTQNGGRRETSQEDTSYCRRVKWDPGGGKGGKESGCITPMGGKKRRKENRKLSYSQGNNSIRLGKEIKWKLLIPQGRKEGKVGAIFGGKKGPFPWMKAVFPIKNQRAQKDSGKEKASRGNWLSGKSLATPVDPWCQGRALSQRTCYNSSWREKGRQQRLQGKGGNRLFQKREPHSWKKKHRQQ